MDFKTLVPDFNAIGKTDWGKPNLDSKDTMGLVALVGAALMLVFVFLPWCTLSAEGETISRLGITTWYVIFGFIAALAAVAGAVYKHYSLTFCAAVLGLVFGVIGWCVVPSFTVEGVTVSGDMIKASIEAAKMFGGAFGAKAADLPSLSHIGAILYLVASVGAGAGAFLKVTK